VKQEFVKLLIAQIYYFAYNLKEPQSNADKMLKKQLVNNLQKIAL